MLKKDMPVSSKEERDRRSKTKEKADSKQRKRMVIEEVESDEDSQGNRDILFYTRQIVLKKKYVYIICLLNSSSNA